METFVSTDKLQLPGLLYQPEKTTKKVAIWLHGMGDNGVFYKPLLMNSLGEALTERGIALFAFNNRGAHGSKSLPIIDDSLPEEDQSYQGGTYYERIADCVHDIDGAVGFLQTRHFETFYLVGLSSGANKVCAYHVRARANPFAKYVLAGPGDDTGLLFKQLGFKRFWAANSYAAVAVTTGDGERIMPKYSGMQPFSAQAAWDVLNPDGAYNTFPLYEAKIERIGTKSLFEEYRQLDRSTLIIYGETDEYTEHIGGVQAAQAIFTAQTPTAMIKKVDMEQLPGAGHSFRDYESAFAGKVADWLVHG